MRTLLLWPCESCNAIGRFRNFEPLAQEHQGCVSPEGQEHWSIEKYTTINPKTNLKWISEFADKEENINEEMPSSNWNLDFSETEGITTVKISIRHEKLADLEMHIQMGFKEGFTNTLSCLAELLST